MIGTEILQGSTINEIICSNSPLNNKQICKGTLSRQCFFSGKFFKAVEDDQSYKKTIQIKNLIIDGIFEEIWHKTNLCGKSPGY